MIVPPPPRRQRVRPGRSRRVIRALVAALIVLLLVVGAAIGAYVIASGLSGDDDNSGGSSSGGTAIALQGIRAFDPPPGDGTEHDDEAGLATDSNPATFWKTETYNTFFKDGVGLVLDAGAKRQVKRLTVHTDTPGFTAEIRAGASPTGPWTTVAPGKPVGATTAFALNNADARYYMVWITDLGGMSVAHVNEVRATG
jgi:hypothetical protein